MKGIKEDLLKTWQLKNEKLKKILAAQAIQINALRRETEIEAAMERVRARAMAMHKPDELVEVAVLLRKEMGLLGVEELETSCIYIHSETTGKTECWFSIQDRKNENNLISDHITIELQDTWVGRQMLAFYSSAELTTSIVMQGANRKEWISYCAEKSALFSVEGFYGEVIPERTYHLYKFNNGYMGAAAPGNISAESWDLLKRATAVFSLAYTRFNDLQIAEAQARAAQIEAALEKVRSRTMAMQRSAELQETAALMFDQIASLNVNIMGCGFNIWNDDRSEATAWMSGMDRFQPPFQTSSSEDIFQRIYERMENGASLFVEEQAGEELEEHYRYMASIPTFKKILEQLASKGLSAPSFQIMHCAYFMHGYLMFITLEHCPDAHEIFVRFAKVFQQAYTRFLDLQRAEAQAWEAEIELSLERVRARAMTMQTSDELSELIGVVFTELTKLELAPTRCLIGIFDPKTKSSRWWLANSEDHLKPNSYYIPNHESPAYLAFLEQWKARTLKYTYVLEGEDKTEWDEFLLTKTELSSLPDFVKEGMKEPDRVILSQSYNSFGFLHASSLAPLSEEHFDILLRFAKVFDLSYTRFNDLMSAEAQAREARIELSLERIRAEAMAMQKSEDLLDIVVRMRTEFLALGHEAHYFWHMKWAPEKYLKAMTSGDGTRIGMVMELPRRIHGEIPSLAAWEKSDRPTVVHVMDVEATLDYVHKMVDWGNFERIDPNMPTEEDIHHIGGLTYVMARTMHGEIGYSLPGRVPHPPEESIIILKRFADAFDLAYRRFEDLQKAEEQARKIKLVNQENERLLHSILPEQIVEQIKTDQKNVVKRFEQVSILFADIVGFTILSEKLSPGEVVDILNGLFSKFDDLTDQYHLEKIKTIGDAYMVAAGVPEERDDHAMAMFHFAQDMLQSLAEYNQAYHSQLKLRIGICSGPVVAGVIGKKKFAYDLWGDTVNTAARMEAYGQAGKIQVAPTSYELLKDDFSFESIPDVDIKGKGKMDVYLWMPFK